MSNKNILFPLVMLLMMIVSFTSCDKDEPYYSPLIGSWELLEDQYGVVPTDYINYFHFYADGHGVYEGYDNHGFWSNWDIWWNDFDRYEDVLEITFEDGTVWSYYWEIYRGYLYLYDQYDSRIYYIYRPMY